jgi:hypothetical protein
MIIDNHGRLVGTRAVAPGASMVHRKGGRGAGKVIAMPQVKQSRQKEVLSSAVPTEAHQAFIEPQSVPNKDVAAERHGAP